MGGRGNSSGMASGGVLDRKAPVRELEAVYREARGFSPGYYKGTILEAIDAKNGELQFVYATPELREKTAKTNRTTYLTYKLRSGADNGEVFGVNWDNVKVVSGQTYDIRSELKERGFRWDKENKRWVRK